MLHTEPTALFNQLSAICGAKSFGFGWSTILPAPCEHDGGSSAVHTSARERDVHYWMQMYSWFYPLFAQHVDQCKRLPVLYVVSKQEVWIKPHLSVELQQQLPSSRSPVLACCDRRQSHRYLAGLPLGNNQRPHERELLSFRVQTTHLLHSFLKCLRRKMFLSVCSAQHSSLPHSVFSENDGKLSNESFSQHFQRIG